MIEAQRIATIPLTQGFEAVIDANDFRKIVGFAWRTKRNRRTNYAISDTRGKRVYMHRLVLGCNEPVDHIDNNGLNNRRSNLRVLSNGDNIRRKRPNLKGSSEFKGVSWYKRTSKWQVTIKVSGKSIAVGHFMDEIDAARAYDQAARVYFGEHAYQNFP